MYLTLLLYGTLHSNGISFLFSFAFHFSSFTALCPYKYTNTNIQIHKYRAICLLRQPFCFVHFFFLGMVLIPVTCTMSQTSVHSYIMFLSHWYYNTHHGMIFAYIYADPSYYEQFAWKNNIHIFFYSLFLFQYLAYGQSPINNCWMNE